MSYFSDLLTSFSRQAGINSPQIARYCGLDRVTVYRFMKGKTLPKDKQTVYRMAEILQLTDDEREALMESYECMRLGFRTYRERIYIRSFMLSFSGKTPAIPTIQYDVEDVKDSLNDVQLISGKASILKRIQREILRECENNQHGIELIMRPGITPVMDMLLSAGKKNKALRVKHLIPITTAFLSNADEAVKPTVHQAAVIQTLSEISSGLGSPTQLLNSPAESGISESVGIFTNESKNLGWDYELLQSFFKIISLCVEGFEYEPFYYYSRLIKFSSFPLYTNLLLTELSVIMFTDDLEEAILFTGKEQIVAFHNKFQRVVDNKPALSYTFRDVASFMDNMNNVILKREKRKDDTEFSYFSQPCIIPVITEEIIKKHLRVALFSEQQSGGNVLQNIYNYVEAIRSRYTNSDYNQICYMPENGIRYFLKTGRFAEVPLEMYSPLTEEERREMLLTLAGQNNFKFRITKTEMSHPEGMLCVEVMDKALFLEFLVPEKGMCFLYINEPGILLTFRSFFSGLSDEELYSEEESREILRAIARETL